MLNVDKLNSRFAAPPKYMVVVAVVVVVMLVASTALATEDAFAGKKKYEKSQAVSHVNDCGNGFIPTNIGCQNTASQIQGDGNAVNVIGVQ